MAAAVTGPGPGPGPARAPEEELPPLEPAEVRRRLEHSERQLRNRRKLLIRGLPADVTNQDIHELLKDFELKYCFVDKYKGTAFVTLLDAEQASSAISQLQGRALRGRALRPQLQPSEALLCVANLPRLLSQQQFEELVRPFGNLERCFLVYSPTTGHSKGYGFVEYMKKDSAARAKSELLGRQLGTRALYVHWSEAGQLSPERLHSRCLCVDKLPHGFGDVSQLRGMAAATCQPDFCQLAVGQDGHLKGFAVLEFPSAAAAERVQADMDGAALAGNHVRVSFCAPGPAGRSMLAALIAAQGMALNRGKGLLPEPNILQILGSLGKNPTSLQLLLSPLLHGAKQGLLGAAPALPLVPSAAPPALLRLLHQHPQKPGILGDSPLSSLPLPPGKLLGEIPAASPLLGDLPQAPGKSQILPSGKSQVLGPFLPRVGPERDKRNSGTPPGLLGGPKNKQGENGGVSLLGEPPKDLRIPLNPFLNLRSLLPPALPGKGFGAKSRSEPSVPPPEFALEFPQDLGSRIFPQIQDPPGFNWHKVSSCPSPGLDRGILGPPFLQGSPSSYFSSGLRAGLKQSHLSKGVSIPPSSDPVVALAPPASHLKTLAGPHKRGCWQLPPPEPSPEGPYVGQHSQGLGGRYAAAPPKRKRLL